MALMMVIVVVGVATVMGMAILSSAALQMSVADNTRRAAAADALAESGLNLALYYLSSPSLAPSLNSNNYWPGQSNISLGSAVNGVTSVTVTAVGGSTDTYTIVATGRSGGINGVAPVSRTLHATVKVNASNQTTQAMTFGQSVSLTSKTSITGNVVAGQTLTVPFGARVQGNVSAKTLSVVGSVTSSTLLPQSYTLQVPTAAQVRDYLTYTYNGQTYSATTVSTSLQNVTLGPTVSNPAGIYRSNGPLKLNGNVIINGSLIVKGGSVSLRGNNNKIGSVKSGFPGLIADGGIEVWKNNHDLVVDGLVYLGSGIVAAGGSTNNSDITINGALIMNQSSIDSAYSGSLTVRYVAGNVNVPDLSTVGKTSQSVSVQSWSE